MSAAPMAGDGAPNASAPARDGHDEGQSEGTEEPPSIDDSTPSIDDAGAALPMGSTAFVCNTGGMGLRQRSGPGADFEALRTLPEGSWVTVVAHSGPWTENDRDGARGWSASAFLCAMPAAPPPPPAAPPKPEWARPLSGYRVTQLFKGASVHNGIDLAKPYGSAVYAAHAGQVTEIIKGYCRAGYACKGTGANWALDPKYRMSGDKVVVTHPDGKKTVYDHVGAEGLSSVGMNVEIDTPVGKINETGNRTGAHLHFAVIVNGVAVNPTQFIAL